MDLTSAPAEFNQAPHSLLSCAQALARNEPEPLLIHPVQFAATQHTLNGRPRYAKPPRSICLPVNLNTTFRLHPPPPPPASVTPVSPLALQVYTTQPHFQPFCRAPPRKTRQHTHNVPPQRPHTRQPPKIRIVAPLPFREIGAPGKKPRTSDIPPLGLTTIPRSPDAIELHPAS